MLLMSLKKPYHLLLKTSHGILQFLSSDWLTSNCIWAHIPLTTNIVADTRERKQLASSDIILLGVFNKTIIPLALVEYEIVKANAALGASLAIEHFISNARS